MVLDAGGSLAVAGDHVRGRALVPDVPVLQLAAGQLAWEALPLPLPPQGSPARAGGVRRLDSVLGGDPALDAQAAARAAAAVAVVALVAWY